VFTAAGHEVRILPAQFVKPYLKANKNDSNDAAAIAEAGSRASMRYVPLKTTEQLELQALHRVRRRFIVERTAVINQMRALLREHGMVIPVGRAAFVHRLPTIFADAEHRLSPRLVELLHRLIGPIIATAVVAAVGDGRMFARGRDRPPGSDGSRASTQRAGSRRSDPLASAGTRTCASSSSKAPSPRSYI
jgi:transposase